MRISPAQCTLTQGQSQQFQLMTLDGPGTVVSGAMWIVTFGPGTIDAGGLYTAPAVIAAPSPVTVTANIQGPPQGSATAKVQLVPVEVVIVPDKVSLREGEQQQFTTKIPGTAAQNADAVTWTLAPNIGTLGPAGQYAAPDKVTEDRDVEIVATSVLDPHTSSKVTVRLLSKPLANRHITALFLYLLAVFALVGALTNLWPPAAAPAAIVDRAQAKRVAADAWVAKLRDDEEKAVAELEKAEESSAGDRDAQIQQKEQAITRLKTEIDTAEKAADKAVADEKELADTHWRVRILDFKSKISREVDLLWLVLVSGALGSFVYTARSFVDFVGNKTIRGSWAAWYLMYPFIGAALALIFYLAVRGGFLTATTSSADINLFGLVAISGLVGMFSKQATSKLGEVFKTMFKTDKEDELKDKLDKQPANKGTTDGDKAKNEPVQGG